MTTTIVSPTARENARTMEATIPERAAGTGGSGYGLLGMRERVALAGGSLRAGPTGGGYRVTAVLPLTESRTGR